MHYNVVSRQNLVDIVERNALGSARCARGLQAHYLVVNVRSKVNRRVAFGRALYIVPVENMSLGNFKFLIRIMNGYHYLGLMCAQLKSLDSRIGYFGIVNIYLSLVVSHYLGCFACRKVEVHGVDYSAELLRSDVAEQELGAVEQLKHHDIRLFNAVAL